MISVKTFSQDKFFKVHIHPAPTRFAWKQYRAIADRLNLSDASADALPLELPDNDHAVDQIELKNALRGEKLPDIGKTETGAIYSPPSMPPPPSMPTAEAPPPSIPFDADGYKALLIPVYKMGFTLLSSKTQTDFNLDSDEAEELASATIPVLRKYVSGNFKYVEETTLITTLVGVYTRKKIKGNLQNMSEKIPVETALDETALDTAKKTFSGMGDLLGRNIDFEKITPIPIDDLTFKKMRDLCATLGIENLSRPEAEKFAAVTSQLNVSIEFLAGIAGQVDPDAVKTLYSKLTEGK